MMGVDFDTVKDSFIKQVEGCTEFNEFESLINVTHQGLEIMRKLKEK